MTTPLLELLRVVILTVIVVLSIVRLTSMPRGHAVELEAWAFILVAIGGFWRLCVLMSRPLLDQDTDEVLSGLVTGLGVLLLCVNALYVNALGLLPDRRTRHEAPPSAITTGRHRLG